MIKEIIVYGVIIDGLGKVEVELAGQRKIIVGDLNRLGSTIRMPTKW